MALTMTPQNLPHGQWSKIDHDHRHPEFSPWAVQWSIDYYILYMGHFIIKIYGKIFCHGHSQSLDHLTSVIWKISTMVRVKHF